MSQYRPHLSEPRRQELLQLRDHSPKPYLRERAAAVLKSAEGLPILWIAKHGLLRPHKADTVRAWLKRYADSGINGLYKKPGGGRKPAFSPQFAQPEAAKQAIDDVLHHPPGQFGVERTRWTLAAILQVCHWLETSTLGGLWALLHRLGIAWKRGREHVHSPDPDYDAKVAQAKALVVQARAQPGRTTVLYQDEFGFYRQPTIANSWEKRGQRQPLAERSYRQNTVTRLVGLLDVVDGRFIYQRRAKIDLRELVGLYQHLRQVYPAAERIHVILDNWPVHFHPDVLVALEPQENRWPVHRPGNWPTDASPLARKRYGHLQLPIQLVPLPTYAPWTDPVEKVWRKLKQEVLHLHRFADRLDDLRTTVDHFLDRFANGSRDLLDYVGLPYPI